MGFIENLRKTLQMQKERELAEEKSAREALEAQKAADEQASILAYKVGANNRTWQSGYKYKHIGIHFDEDWKIRVIGIPSKVISLSKNKWHGKQREQEKALENAYLHPAILESLSLPTSKK